MFHKKLEHLPQEGAKCAMVLSTDHEVCAVIDSTLNPRTASDYARLFATAPQLLEECKQLIEVLEWEIKTGLPHGPKLELIEKAKAAVKAAEGGQ